jgi:hypothetical protein
MTQITLTSADEATVQGTIDGAALAPFSIKADPKSLKLANGSAIPAMIVDNDTQQALPALLQGMQRQCAQKSGAAVGQVTHTDAVSMADPPAQFYNPYSSVPCLTCMLGCESFNMVCWGQALYSATLCGPFYGICLAGELLACSYEDIGCYGNTAVQVPNSSIMVGPCHMLTPTELRGGSPSSLGPPCCPTFCGTSTAVNSGSFCCGAGATCAAPPLCCSSGLTACGTNCCPSGQTCVGGNTCCPTSDACGSSCCATGQTCAGGSTCCDPSNACGPNCCAPGQTCLQDSTTCCAPANVCGRNNCCNPGDSCASNGSCCPAGHTVCNGICCPNANTACDPTTHSCSSSCAGGAPSCGGTCCPASQLCCTGINAAPVCATPVQRAGYTTWCGNNSQQIQCNNCPPGQQCAEVCTESNGVRLCSEDMYCQ